MQIVTADRPRDYVRVQGPQAADYLNRMVSNDVLALEVGGSCDALLLTAKARVIATLRILRRGETDFLLLTEPGLGAIVRDQLTRMRFAARCEVEPERHTSTLLLGEGVDTPAGAVALPNPDYGVAGLEALDVDIAPTIDADELERLRIEAGTPLAGKDIDDRVLPAEAGLTERAVSFTKGCYPGQEPVARLHYRGHANRVLRVLRVDGGDLPAAGAELVHQGKAVGRITSAVRANGGFVALGYVRAEVTEDAVLEVGEATATMLRPARP